MQSKTLEDKKREWFFYSIYKNNEERHTHTRAHTNTHSYKKMVFEKDRERVTK